MRQTVRGRVAIVKESEGRNPKTEQSQRMIFSGFQLSDFFRPSDFGGK